MRTLIESSLQHKQLLIFGGAGSLGNALVEYYRGICDIAVASRDEAKHWELKNKFGTSHKFKTTVQSKTYSGTYEGTVRTQLATHVCDVRDLARVKQVIRTTNPDYIIIAQALKQIDTCENNPGESIDTNITGIRNILEAIEEHSMFPNSKIHCVCFVSTDKACNPVNVYGMCKSISERLVDSVRRTSKVKYVTTRYGNVLSTTGSIIPLFLKQAMSPEVLHFTVTDPNMTRFMMQLPESVELIDDAMHDTSPGIYIPRLDAFRVKDLVVYFSKKYNKPFKIIGARPGEKIHELLFSEEESARLSNVIQARKLVIVRPTDFDFNSKGIDKEDVKEYSSGDHVISEEELKLRLDSFLEKGYYVKSVRKAEPV